MQSTEGKRLAELAAAVRESTLKRLRRVPAGRENFRVGAESMSFADTARHLIDADEWLFAKLRNRDLTPMRGRPGLAEIGSRSEYLELLQRLEETGQARNELVDSMTDEQLEEQVPDARFSGEVSVWWLIARGNLDHETHHRGWIAACLRAVRLQD